MNTTWSEVMAKSCIITGRGSSIVAVWAGAPSLSNRKYSTCGSSVPAAKASISPVRGQIFGCAVRLRTEPSKSTGPTVSRLDVTS